MRKDKEDLILKCQLMLLSMTEKEVVIPRARMETYMNISSYKDECVEKLFELTNKETPMKPVNDDQCGRCEVMVIVFNGYRLSYCPNCGQKADWSDNNQ